MSLFKTDNWTSLIRHPLANMNDTPLAILKIALAWLAAAFAKVSETAMKVELVHLVQVAALLFTVLQIVFLIRDKWWRQRRRGRVDRRRAVRPQQPPL